MERESYWVRRQRFGRRRLLQGTAVAGVGAGSLALVGCGDDDDKKPTGSATQATSGTGTSASGSPSATAKATEQVKKGGKITGQIPSFPATLDPYPTSDTYTRNHWAGFIYSKLVVPKGVPPGPDFPSPDVVEDLATSWETADKLTYTFKLNPKAKWHAPLGRALVADDVVFAWNRFSGKSAAGKPAVNTEQLDMVDSVTAVDKNTVVWKLKAPSALFMYRMADDYVLPILPPEVEKNIDVTATGVGTGPWIVDQINRPTGFTLKRNPEWHLGPDRPYTDTREWVAIPDPANALNQYKGGNVDLAPVFGAKDVPGMRSAIPGLKLGLGQAGTAMPYVAFSSLDPSAPWMKDVRVRYALSMCIDRNALWEYYYPAKDYTDAGLTAPKVQWHGILPTGLGPEYVDPQGSKFDPSLKQYFEYSPDKAKALLAQAGYPDGITFNYHYTTSYGAQFTAHAELVLQMLAKGGFKPKGVIDDFQSVFIPKTFLKGDFDGMAQIYQGYGTSLEWLSGLYIPGSSRNQGHIDDSKLTDMIKKLNGELDFKARVAQIPDIVNYIAKNMYYVPGMLGAAPAMTAVKPNLHNVNEFATARSGTGYWAAYQWRDA